MHLLLELPTTSKVVLGIVVLIGLSIMGVISDLVLRERGYGVGLNGVFVTAGALLGVVTQFRLSGLV